MCEREEVGEEEEEEEKEQRRKRRSTLAMISCSLRSVDCSSSVGFAGGLDAKEE